MAAAVISAVTGLAHDIGLTVIAEGVETEQQAEVISRFGCDLAQGNYYARPMPADTIFDLPEGSDDRKVCVPNPATNQAVAL